MSSALKGSLLGLTRVHAPIPACTYVHTYTHRYTRSRVASIVNWRPPLLLRLAFFVGGRAARKWVANKALLYPLYWTSRWLVRSITTYYTLQGVARQRDPLSHARERSQHVCGRLRWCPHLTQRVELVLEEDFSDRIHLVLTAKMETGKTHFPPSLSPQFL